MWPTLTHTNNDMGMSTAQACKLVLLIWQMKGEAFKEGNVDNSVTKMQWETCLVMITTTALNTVTMHGHPFSVNCH